MWLCPFNIPSSVKQDTIKAAEIKEKERQQLRVSSATVHWTVNYHHRIM